MTSGVLDEQRRRTSDLTLLVVGLGVLAAGMVVVREGKVGGWEERVFRVLNDLPGWLHPMFWPFQQMGALGAGGVVALVAYGLGRRRLAAAAGVVTLAKLLLERGVKTLVSRQRPAASIGPDIHTRGDVSTRGDSFVSGHALLVAALAGIIAPVTPPKWRWVLWAVVAIVCDGRVYVGAHNPLDVVCGAGLGAALASAVNLTVRPAVARETAPGDPE